MRVFLEPRFLPALSGTRKTGIEVPPAGEFPPLTLSCCCGAFYVDAERLCKMLPVDFHTEDGKKCDKIFPRLSFINSGC